MAKERVVDPITLGIIAVTFLLTLLLLIQSGIVTGKSLEQQKIAILDTSAFVDDLNSNLSNEFLLELQEKIDAKTSSLKSQGYIVLRSDVVRGAPSEFYVTVED